MKRITCLVFALLLVPMLASAQQQKTPGDWFKDGETQYNLGNFSEAIDAFKKAYALETVESNKAVYLYNIAQAYRFAKDCSNAQFFYKRFLATRDAIKPPLDAQKRNEIEARIKELEECARNAEAIKNRPPDQNLKPEDPNGNGGNGSGPGGTKPDPNGKGPHVATKDPKDPNDPDDDNLKVHKPAELPPSVVSVRLVAGGAKISAGDLNVPVQATGALLGGYPIALDKLIIEVGAGFTFTPVPFQGQMASKTAQLIGLLANVGATYIVAPKIGVRGDLGIGAQWFNGVGDSPFTNNAPTSGALPMFHVRAAVSADFAITPNFIVTAVPFVLSYSPPASGLRDDIKSIRAFEFMAGAGYRM